MEFVVGHRVKDDAPVLPMNQIRAVIAGYTNDIRAVAQVIPEERHEIRIGVLVFPIPIVTIVMPQQAAAVGLDLIAIGIQQGAGRKRRHHSFQLRMEIERAGSDSTASPFATETFLVSSPVSTAWNREASPL